MPAKLEPGVLYFSEEFEIASHLCPCGCGQKVRTPVGPADWSLVETPAGPSLYPSIGNWQHDCQSHYWVRQGRIIWAEKWSERQVIEGRQFEAERDKAYYEQLYRNTGMFNRLLNWIKQKLQ